MSIHLQPVEPDPRPRDRWGRFVPEDQDLESGFEDDHEDDLDDDYDDEGEDDDSDDDE